MNNFAFISRCKSFFDRFCRPEPNATTKRSLVGCGEHGMTYQPIEHRGIIGDKHTVALVGMNGLIDWLCPHFDSPSVVAAMLDDAESLSCRQIPVVMPCLILVFGGEDVE